MVRTAALLLLALGLASCRAESSTDAVVTDKAETGDASASPVPEPVPPGTRLPDPPKPPPAPPIGGLLPIGRAAVESELEPGAGCSLDGTGTAGPLLVAVAGDAIVNLDGRIIHLKPQARDMPALFKGGRFTGSGLVVEIEREHEVKRVDEVTTWQATLRISGGKLRFTSFHHRWSCGA